MSTKRDFQEGEQGSSVAAVKEQMRNLKEKAFLSIIEDIQDPTISTTDELVRTCYMLEEKGQDEEANTEEMQFLAQTLHSELVKRAHELESDEVQAVSAIFQRLYAIRVVEKPLPRLSDEIRAQAKIVASSNELIRNLIPECEPSQIITYDRRMKKIAVRVDSEGSEYRVVFQSINNRSAMYLERALETLGKENPLKIFLSLSPFGTDEKEIVTFNTPEEIDLALMTRYQGKAAFRIGTEARVVYEKVSHIKRISVNHSLIYNFSSDGVFSQLGIPVSLFRPTPDESISLLGHELAKAGLEEKDLLRNLQAQLFIDRLHWIRDVLKYNGCPRCNLEKVNNGPENITPAFIDHVSPKLLSTRFLEEVAASNIKKIITQTLVEAK